MSSLTTYLKIRYKRFVHNQFEYILNLEATEKIRDDFVVFYNASLSSKSLISRAYSGKSQRWYYNRIVEWGIIAKKYNPFKFFLTKVDKKIDDLENVSSLFSILDWIRTLLPFVSVYIAIKLENYNGVLSIIFLIFSIILVILNGGLEILRIHTNEIQGLIETLIFTESNILMADGSLPDKNELYGPYIWNRSLCDPSTISIFFFLLFLKKIRPSFYGRIIETGKRLFPLYMTSDAIRNKKISRINFINFYFKNRRPPKKPGES